MTSTTPVSDSQIAEYQRDGVVCLRAAFSSDWVTELSRGLEKNFADRGPDSTTYTPADKPGGFYDDYCNWQRIDEYRDFIFNSPAGEIAARLCQSSAARIYHEHVLVKEPGTEEVTPWHHDFPYYGIDGQQLCSVWLPLDPVPKIACPEFVAGSHRNGKCYFPRLFVSHEDYADSAEGYESVPDIDAHRSDYRILSWDLALGDCLAFDMRTIHGAPATTRLTTRRRGFSTRWLGDDARFATRPWTTSPPFREIDLQPGDPFDDSRFPVVWPR